MGLISKIKSEYEDYAKDLQTERDDIEVRLHLLSMDMKDEWQEMEQKFQHFRARLDKITEVAEDSVEEVAEALKQTGEEVKQGYQRIKASLKLK